ncbi:hypothetical protein OSB04_007204 [Centaurea solstitialis]|uniref:Uncharacterized protein n=1 Tax=Centaurea solstitialis TaxID=347529 RepID=A0AA38TL66_9ASTR|nr:hypothetical protein OSB04_007204 [Centaurea solstitialis]
MPSLPPLSLIFVVNRRWWLVAPLPLLQSLDYLVRRWWLGSAAAAVVLVVAGGAMSESVTPHFIYINSLFKKKFWFKITGVTTPVDLNAKLSATDGPLFHDPTLYRSLAGALQYLTFTRPDISYAVQQVCLFMHEPHEPHFAFLKRIIRYLQGTLSYGIRIVRSTTTSLVAYSDADWGGCPDSRRSTSGYCVFFGDNLISWSSKCQSTVSRSSAEAEYRGVANAVAEATWVRNLLLELQLPLRQASVVYCDNVCAVYLSDNPVQHQRTKHIEIDIHFVREKVRIGHIRVLHVPSSLQYADIFTKGLPRQLFESFRSNCGGLADRSIAYPKGKIEDILVKVDKFIFLADFIILDCEVNKKVPIILERPFLATGRALIDVHKGELTMRVNDQQVTFNVFNSLKCSGGIEDCSAVSVIDTDLDLDLAEYGEEYTTVVSDDLTFDDSLQEDVAAVFEQLDFKNRPSHPPSIVQPPELELKPLPSHLKYAYLLEDEKLPVIILSKLDLDQETKLLDLLRDHKRALGWTIADNRGISLSICQHKIILEENSVGDAVNIVYKKRNKF